MIYITIYNCITRDASFTILIIAILVRILWIEESITSIKVQIDLHLEAALVYSALTLFTDGVQKVEAIYEVL